MKALIFVHQILSRLPDSTEGNTVYQLLMRLIGSDPEPTGEINREIMK